MILINSLIWNKKKKKQFEKTTILLNTYIYMYINCMYKHVYNQIYNEN